ncbi:MAG TPA: hypothetical protein VJZ25_02920 [Gemmatimonadaceae bacterium]|nr:hypothetical protein [Gemmatimonadaceae bacterium]
MSSRSQTSTEDLTRRTARIALAMSLVGIAVAYGAAFLPAGAPVWAPWLLAIGIPVSIGAIMILGATRGRSGIGPLRLPFAFVVVTLAAGFCGALLLPATENPGSELWLGLPARAAIIIYGIGLLPTIVLPLAYALTFESQTLTAADIERVRSLASEIERERLPPDPRAPVSSP